MPRVLFEKDGHFGRITLNRPELMNAIDDDLPRELAAAVVQADGGIAGRTRNAQLTAPIDAQTPALTSIFNRR